MFNKIKEFILHKDKIVRSNRHIFIVILVTALLGLLAAFVLTIEAFELAKNPNRVLNCSINIVINCATVANSKYSALFGFPNSMIGLIGETIFVVIAVAYLMGAKFTKKFMFGAQIAAFMALIFATGLFYISSFIIQAICPWCMLVFISTIVMFFAITRYNIRENNLYLPRKTNKIVENMIEEDSEKISKAIKYIEKDYDKFLLAIIIVAIVAFLIIKYGAGLFA